MAMQTEQKLNGLQRFFRFFTRRIWNPLVMRFAGRYIYAVIIHEGRRTETLYATPVLAAPTPEGFAIPMPDGELDDWVRNVETYGSAVIRYRGKDYEVAEPAVVFGIEARAHFPQPWRFLLGLFRVDEFMILRRIEK